WRIRSTPRTEDETEGPSARRGQRRQVRRGERLEIVEGAADERFLAPALVADRLLERRQEAGGDVGGVGGLLFRRRDVARPRAERGRGGEDRGRRAFRETRRVDPRNQPRRRRFEVPLDAGDLPREEEVAAAARLERRQEDRRRVDVRIAVHLPEPRE